MWMVIYCDHLEKKEKSKKKMMKKIEEKWRKEKLSKIEKNFKKLLWITMLGKNPLSLYMLISNGCF